MPEDKMPHAAARKARIRSFLSTALPLWEDAGVDRKGGGFVEYLNPDGTPAAGARRTLSQARQMYSFRVARDLGFGSEEKSANLVEHGRQYLLKQCSLPSGAFNFSQNPDGIPLSEATELYTQAFGLFGLAQAQRIAPQKQNVDRALALVEFLRRERRVEAGGYLEIKSGERLYQSNPHMHLFEAALAWMDIDPNPAWRELADEIALLCLTHFIDPETHLLAEHFTADWNAVRHEGRFVIEPGHQYEWSWLLGWYAKHAAKEQDLLPIRIELFENAERLGAHPGLGHTIDEVWSDGTPKSLGSRFWPHCERIKAAVQLRGATTKAEGAIDSALNQLFHYLDVPKPGLWLDTRDADGKLVPGPAKASSLYHIIGGLAEILTAAT